MTRMHLTRRHMLQAGAGLAGAGMFGRAANAAGTTLTVGTNIPFITLDPNSINTSVFPFRNAVFDPLISIRVTDIPSYKLGKIEPVLANAYTVNPDYTQIRLRIRNDVTFHNGNFPAHWDPKLRIPRGQVVAAASIVSPKY